ncbi:hypothetical protein C5167_014893 [Papaver somniferum]|uniref:Uncharacterized protein n=1 Tax=Papaver somniferum TaxID=3469 RepID=A0A4Y7J7L2_PAPSO|nr:hypothetical protein C5167_014893 [Papaver somniferum]
MSSSSKLAYHSRSISLPTRSDPFTFAVEEQLCKLRSSDLTSSISNNLVALKDLSVMLLDVCGTIKDALSQMKQSAQDLQSSIRRWKMLKRGLGKICHVKDVLSRMKQSAQDLQSSIRRRSNEFDAYVSSRKKICKVIQKCLSDLKRNTNKNNDVVADASLLTEVEAAILAVFESVMSFLSAPKQNNWSLVSKLTTKHAAQVVNKVTKVDIALKPKVIEAKEVQKPLASLEMNLEDLEDGLESVFRRLFKNRVSLLNILNH